MNPETDDGETQYEWLQKCNRGKITLERIARRVHGKRLRDLTTDECKSIVEDVIKDDAEHSALKMLASIHRE